MYQGLLFGRKISFHLFYLLAFGLLSAALAASAGSISTAGGRSKGFNLPSEMEIRIRNVKGGNPGVPGNNAMVSLSNENFSFVSPTKNGVAVFEGVPEASDFKISTEVTSDSKAYENPVEYWGTMHNVTTGSSINNIEYVRNMPYITGVRAVDGERFTGFSAVEAGKPLMIQVYINNTASFEVPLNILVKLHNHSNDSIISLEQSVIAKSGKETIVLLSYTPREQGYYFFAPALKLVEHGMLYTDCWDWSDQPLFSVVTHKRMIEFAGYKWHVKSGFGPPGPNMWSDFPGHVWVDDNGELILTLTPGTNRWLATEVVSDDYFGYGTYTFFLKSNPSDYDPHMVAALFLYKNEENEIDIEFTRWGDSLNVNVGNYVIQPSVRPGNQFMFPMNLQGTFSTHRFIWSPGKVVFESWHGHHTQPQPYNMISRWESSGDNIPSDDHLRLHLNFWLFRGIQPHEAIAREFIISGFSFSPLHAPEVNP